jgi:two-component system heavy metal sensor histidine kinase CusS
MTRNRWSIAGRLTRGFAWTIGLLVVSTSGISAYFLNESMSRELDALTLEELHEMRASFKDSDGTREAFRELAKEFGDEHATNPFAWRIWEVESGRVWDELGRSKLLELVPERWEPLDVTREPKTGLRWRTESLTPSLTIGLMIDGGFQVALVRRFGLVMLSVIGSLSLLAIAGGALLGRKLARQLHDVAAQARAVQVPATDHELYVEGAPEEIREVADALCEMLRNIRRENDRARLLTAGLAHELRSPIQNLMGEAEVALLRDRTPDDYREVIASQVEELHDLGRVVDNLVLLCSPTSDREARVTERFDLEREAHIRLEQDRSEGARRDVAIDFSATGSLEIDGDREALMLALHNLVSNAIKWSPPGSTVVVELEGSEDRVEMRVADSGPGIPEDMREQIFQPFNRGPVRGDGRVGYGLGLALVRIAVEGHGGEIEVLDSPSGGALFRISIPREVVVQDNRSDDAGEARPVARPA